MQYTPVFDTDNRQLMPTKTQRAIRWVNTGKATPFYKKGVWCVRLNVEPSARNYQPIAVGVDPGSKREGITVKSKAHTYLNIQAHAVDWGKRCSRDSPQYAPSEKMSEHPLPSEQKQPTQS